MSSSSQSYMMKVVPMVGAAAVVGYLVYRKMCGGGASCDPTSSSCINMKVCKDKEKVADAVDVSEFGEKAAFCRCWKSNKFPYCDGAHNAHNKETGDNVGPLIITKKSS